LNSSIRDWIQTIAVVIGISLGVWEFFIHDRIQENARKAFVSDMIIKGTSDSVMKSYASLPKLKQIFSEGKHTPDVDKFEFDVLALDSYFDAWGFCYKNNLCDRFLTKEYVCRMLISYSKLEKEFDGLTEREYKIDQDYALLLTDCTNKGS